MFLLCLLPQPKPPIDKSILLCYGVVSSPEGLLEREEVEEMSHGIHKEKFVSVREPAWHRIGLHFLEPIPPSLAASVSGFEEPDLFPLMLPNGEPSGYYGVVSKDGEVFGTVTSRWELIRLEDVMDVLDEIAKEFPLSAAGQLREGRYVFFTFEHRGQVLGEEYLKHIVVLHSYEPGKAWKVLYSPTRVVCMNTLVVSEKESSFTISVKHFRGAQGRARGAAIVAVSKAKQEEVDRKLEALAKVGDFDAQIDALLDYVYAFPEPPEFQGNESEEDKQRALRFYENRMEATAFAREAFLESYERFNDEYPRLARTAYAGLQAVLETADWRTGPKRSPKETRRLDEARVLGARAKEKVLGWRFVTSLL